MEKVYKIVEKDGDVTKTIFHGYNKSRIIPSDKWLKAEKKIVQDGSSGRYYLSGWHVIKNEKAAIHFLKTKFRKRLDKLFVVPCMAIGLRQKPTNPLVYLADWIKF